MYTDLSKLKAYEDKRLNMAKVIQLFNETKEKIVGEKGQKRCFPTFSSFLWCFSKAVFLRAFKTLEYRIY